MEAGRSLLGSIVFYFSFFTILTNIGAVLVHTSLLSPSFYAWLPAFASNTTKLRRWQQRFVLLAKAGSHA